MTSGVATEEVLFSLMGHAKGNVRDSICRVNVDRAQRQKAMKAGVLVP